MSSIFYVAGRKTGEVFLEKSYREFPPKGLDAHKASICSEHKIQLSDLSFWYTENTESGDIWDIRHGALWKPVWENNEITGVDLADETKRLILKCSATKSEIEANDIDTATITIEVHKADDSGIDKTVNTTQKIPILFPEGIRDVYVTFVNGSASTDFKTSIPGCWGFPAYSERFPDGSYRVGSYAKLESIINFSNI